MAMWNLGFSVAKSLFGQFSSTMKRVWVQEISQKKISVSVGLCCSVIAGFCTGAEAELIYLRKQLVKVESERNMLTEQLEDIQKAGDAKKVEAKKLARLAREEAL